MLNVGDKMGGMVGGDNGESEGDEYTRRGVTEVRHGHRGGGVTERNRGEGESGGV